MVLGRVMFPRINGLFINDCPFISFPFSLRPFILFASCWDTVRDLVYDTPQFFFIIFI